jgi:DNA-binding protein Fis
MTNKPTLRDLIMEIVKEYGDGIDSHFPVYDNEEVADQILKLIEERKLNECCGVSQLSQVRGTKSLSANTTAFRKKLVEKIIDRFVEIATESGANTIDEL